MSSCVARLAALPGCPRCGGSGCCWPSNSTWNSSGVTAGQVATLLPERGVVVNAVTPTALRLAPSLLITDDEIDLAVDAIATALADLDVVREWRPT